jgi:hypothetical protein
MDEDIKSLGGIPSPLDRRDFNIGALAPSQDIPESFSINIVLPDYYQNGQPACGGHAAAGMVSSFEAKELGTPTKVSPRFVYAWCKAIDGFNGDGTYLRSILQTLQNKGAPKLELWPNDVHLSTSEYIDLSKATQDVFEDANVRVIKSYGMQNEPSFQDIKKAIYNYGGVIALKYPWIPGVYNDGHFIFLTGYDKDYVYFHNSFPMVTSYNANGTYNGRFTEQDCSTITEIGTAVDVSDSTIPMLKSKISILQKLAYLYNRLIYLKGLLK